MLKMTYNIIKVMCKGGFSMPNTIITIARSYGSGGRTIGKMVAEKLGYAYYDRNLIYLASDKSGIDIRLLFEHDENVKKGIIDKISEIGVKSIPPESRNFSSSEEIFNTQARVIKDLADLGDAVMIGRCAGHILKGSGHKLVRVFIWASPEKCLETVMNKFSISAAEAKRTINDIDRHRREYFKYYTGNDWDSAKNYDLSICIDDLPPEEAVDRIIDFSRIIR